MTITKSYWAFVIAAALVGMLIPSGAAAQLVRKANNADGKFLTMEQVVFSGDTSPRFSDEVRNLLGERFNGGLSWDDPQRRGRDKAWTENGNVYIRTSEGAKMIAECSAGIVCGETVSRNEFGISGGLFWSPDSLKLAYYRKDERAVTEFPLLDITTRTGSLKAIRYPMAGMPSEKISLLVHDVRSGVTATVNVDDFTDERYLTNVSWSPDSRTIYIQVLSRDQKEMHMNAYDAASGAFLRTVLTETDSRYVEPLDPIRFLKGRDDLFVYRTNVRDGYGSLYLCDTLGTVRRLTCVDADVRYVANDGAYVYYTSAEVSTAEQHFFRISLRKQKKTLVPGKVTRLTFESGWHNISMDGDLTGFIDWWTALDNPGTVCHVSADGKERRFIAQAEDPTCDFAYTEIELGAVPSADGRYMNNYRLVKPLGFDPSKKYPLIVYVYGGPHSQMVKNNWLASLRRWEMYMAQRGWLVYVQDNRGTLNCGAEYEKAIHRQCGVVEAEDQMVGVRRLMEMPYVDTGRIGVGGWSYGGFMAITLLTGWPDVFKVGVAGGPVIDWKWYEVMYGERYMDTPQTNPDGYERTSLLGKACSLKGRLLICQGAVDNTVVWQHSLSFINECIKNNVRVDYFPYPLSEHNVRGKDRIHLLEKITQYYEEHL